MWRPFVVNFGLFFPFTDGVELEWLLVNGTQRAFRIVVGAYFGKR